MYRSGSWERVGGRAGTGWANTDFIGHALALHVSVAVEGVAVAAVVVVVSWG